MEPELVEQPPPLAEEAKSIEAESFIIEGETIVTNEAGLSDFHALRSALPGARKTSTWSCSTFCTSTATICAT
jgi:ATP-dependent DNA ligase